MYTFLTRVPASIAVHMSSNKHGNKTSCSKLTLLLLENSQPDLCFKDSKCVCTPINEATSGYLVHAVAMNLLHT